jgi:hypothetical protein
MRKIATIILWSVFVLSAGFFVACYLVLTVGHIPELFPLTLAMFIAHWLATVAACALVFRWSYSSIQRRFWCSVILSLVAMASSYWGLTCIHITSTQTVNGHFRCLFDSRWLFTTSLILATFTLAFTLWKRWRLRDVWSNKSRGCVKSVDA